MGKEKRGLKILVIVKYKERRRNKISNKLFIQIIRKK